MCSEAQKAGLLRPQGHQLLQDGAVLLQGHRQPGDSISAPCRQDHGGREARAAWLSWDWS